MLLIYFYGIEILQVESKNNINALFFYHFKMLIEQNPLLVIS